MEKKHLGTIKEGGDGNCSVCAQCFGIVMDYFWGLLDNNEGNETTTSIEQRNCEETCALYLLPPSKSSKGVIRDLRETGFLNDLNEICLLRKKHSNYLTTNLSRLPHGFSTLDASRPWMIFWIVHGLCVLDAEPIKFYDRVIDTLRHMQNASGGFGGGPMQLSHGAPNYASVMTLCEIGSEASLSLVNRPAMYNYLMSMKHPNGGFSMHRDGEVDTRSCYTALAVARVLNILTPELCEGVTEFLLSCQTYEGGFGGEPYNEAHGGYNFCALAGLLILGQAQRCDVERQRRWLLKMQTQLEGGFRGRTNKLVDACYSYWQGAAFSLLALVDRGLGDLGDCSDDAPLVSDLNSVALQMYILHCAQQPDGGLRDKPGKSRDFYHSCYALSGLSIAQHSVPTCPAPEQVYGDSSNKVCKTSCVFNMRRAQVVRTVEFYSSFPSSHQELVALYESS